MNHRPKRTRRGKTREPPWLKRKKPSGSGGRARIRPGYKRGTARHFLWDVLKKKNPELFEKIKERLWDSNKPRMQLIRLNEKLKALEAKIKANPEKRLKKELEKKEKEVAWKILEEEKKEKEIIIPLLKELEGKVDEPKIKQWIQEETNRLKLVNLMLKKKRNS